LIEREPENCFKVLRKYELMGKFWGWRDFSSEKLIWSLLPSVSEFCDYIYFIFYFFFILALLETDLDTENTCDGHFCL